MFLDEPSYPTGGRVDLSGSSSRNELQVLLNGAVRVRVHVHAGQVTVNQRDESREFSLLMKHNALLHTTVDRNAILTPKIKRIYVIVYYIYIYICTWHQ